MGSKENEGKACDAILRELEKREGGVRQEIQLPENDPSIAPDARVELVCKIRDRLFALEHTYIEPFEGFRNMEMDVPQFSRDLLARLEQRLIPSEKYELLIRANALRTSGLNTRDSYVRMVDALANWIVQAAPSLPLPEGRREMGVPAVLGPLQEIPFEIALSRRAPSDLGPHLRVASLVGSDREEQRRMRLQRAYETKCPKLAKWKQISGARTVLILEDDDFQGTNESLVESAVREVETGRLDVPDEVYLLNVGLRATWWIYRLRIESLWHSERQELAGRWWEVDPTNLDQVTKRKRA